MVKAGDAAKAFEVLETEIPASEDNQVVFTVEVFGLNFADVMCRLGLYPECPPLPTIIVRKEGPKARLLQRLDEFTYSRSRTHHKFLSIPHPQVLRFYSCTCRP